MTEHNIARKTRSMMRKAAQYRSRPLHLDPGSSALLVIDMQRYFTDHGSHAFLPSAPAIITPVKELIAVFLNNKRPVILTRHINTDQNAGMLDRWWNGHITAHSVLSGLTPGLINDRDRRGITVMVKSQYDAFHKTRLQRLLKKHRIRQVLIAGVMTNLCCETTARSAFVRGFEVFFAVDATATQNEDLHVSTIRNLSHGFAVCMQVEEIIDAFGSPRRKK